VLLFAATDAITYAATGSSLVLGKINQANAVTTIQNTGTGNALRLLTKSTATAPLVVNGKGKVTNLYSDRAATADNAARVGGKTPAQIVADASAGHLAWGAVNRFGLTAGSPNVKVTHVSTGNWCVTVQGVNLSALNSGGITATPVFDWDDTSIDMPNNAVTAHVEIHLGGDATCPTGIVVLTSAVRESNGSSPSADGGFTFTIIH
jgi:hypothetical protein